VAVRTVRWILCFLFGLGALAFGKQTLVLVQDVTRGTQTYFPATPLSGGALLAIPALALVYGMACWTFLRGKRSARGWGIVASATFILLTLMIYWLDRRDGGSSVPDMAQMEMMTLGVGVVGVIAFGRRDVSAFAPAAKSVPADGTHIWLGRLAVIAAVGGTWFGLEGWEHWARLQGLRESGWITYLLAIPLLIFCHEAGHAVAAMALRMKVCTFGIGPFVWSRWEGSWKFMVQSSQMWNVAGMTQVVPTRLEGFRRDKILQVGAGPAASVMTGGAGLALLLMAPGSVWEPAWYFLAVFVTLSAVIAVVNLIPTRIGGGYSDGAKLYQCLSSEAWTEYYREQAVGYAQWVTPLRPRDSDVEALWRVVRWLPGGNERAQYQLEIVAHYFDKGDWGDAVRVLVQTEEELRETPQVLTAHLMVVLVFYHAFLRRDAVTARQWWDRAVAKKPETGKDFGATSLCALLLMERRREEAEEAWVRAKSWAGKLAVSGAGNMERAVVGMLRERLDAAPESTLAIAD
jgi:hypothetical protein